MNSASASYAQGAGTLAAPSLSALQILDNLRSNTSEEHASLRHMLNSARSTVHHIDELIHGVRPTEQRASDGDKSADARAKPDGLIRFAIDNATENLAALSVLNSMICDLNRALNDCHDRIVNTRS